jgi:hypothetical protein
MTTDEKRAAELWFANPGPDFLLVIRSPAGTPVGRVKQTSHGPVLCYWTVDPEPTPAD